MSKKEKSNNVYRLSNTPIIVGCIVLVILVTVILVSANMLMNLKNNPSTTTVPDQKTNNPVTTTDPVVTTGDVSTPVTTSVSTAPTTYIVTTLVPPISTAEDITFNPELTTTERQYSKEPRTANTISAPAENIAKGSLVLIDSSHQFILANKLTRAEMAGLSSATLKSRYGFSVVDSSKFFKRKINQFLDIDANTEFVNMMNAFAYATGLTDVQLRNAYYYDSSETVCYNVSGLHVDLEVLSDKDGKLYPLNHSKMRASYYDWFIENSWKFGFIHVGEGKSSTGEDIYSTFRYVGIVHATYIHNNNMSLENYLNFLKDHDVNKALTITDPWGVSWIVYYVKATGQTTSITVYGSEQCYRISGNNDDGFIVTINTAYFQ